MEVYSQRYIADIRERFDLIAVDPRGVGRSTPSNCSSSIYNERVSLFPKTEEEYERLVDKNRRLGESCRSRTGKVIDYVDTISAAKDHEAVRAALGGKMNWLGFSYGTQLGAQYAQLFPQHVRAMALDAILQHSQAESSNILIESTTFNAEIKSFFSWAQRSNYSSLQGKDVEKMWKDLINSSTTAPIPAPGCDNVSCRSDVNAEEILFNAQDYVDDWVGFADALSQASTGNATLLSSSLAQDPFLGVYAGTTIGCKDWAPAASSFADMQTKMRIGEIFTPLTRGACGAWSFQASCIGWPSRARNPPAKLNVQTENTILLTTTMQDPATSYTWAVGMLQEIKNHFFLVRSGGGHGSYTRGGKITAATNHYLITLELPPVGTVLDS